MENKSGCSGCPRDSACAAERAYCEFSDGMTNADRIRAMSDEELAAFLTKDRAEEAILRVRDQGCEPTATQIQVLTDGVYRIWLAWLKRPAEEP